MRFARTDLGLIPDWQFSMDPAVNPKINPHVKYPDGMYQTTVQPIGPYYQGPESQLGYKRPSFFGDPGTPRRRNMLLGLGGLGVVSLLGALFAIR